MKIFLNFVLGMVVGLAGVCLFAYAFSSYYLKNPVGYVVAVSEPPLPATPASSQPTKKVIISLHADGSMEWNKVPFKEKNLTARLNDLPAGGTVVLLADHGISSAKKNSVVEACHKAGVDYVVVTAGNH